jgi:hypothetical protein
MVYPQSLVSDDGELVSKIYFGLYTFSISNFFSNTTANGATSSVGAGAIELFIFNDQDLT